MATVWVYPEKCYEQLGAERWEASWEEVKPAAIGKDEIDIDADLLYKRKHFADKGAALKCATHAVNSLLTAFGAARVVRQEVVWESKSDRIAKWEDAEEPEIID